MTSISLEERCSTWLLIDSVRILTTENRVSSLAAFVRSEVAREREACAKLFDGGADDDTVSAPQAAEWIRARVKS